MIILRYIRTMDGRMNQQDYAGAYRAAMNVARNELDLSCQESMRLTNRHHRLGTAIGMLKPLIDFSKQAIVEDRRPAFQAVDTADEPVRTDDLNLQKAGIAISHFVPQKMIESADPIQRRIDLMLGRAVA